MATTTPRLALKYIQQAQAQKEVTHAEALNLLDAVIGSSVKYFQRNTPPTSPAEGDLYVVGDNPTGVWASQAAKLAQYIDSGWQYYTPFDGLILYDEWTQQHWAYDGATWSPNQFSRTAYRVQTINNSAYELSHSDIASILKLDTSGGPMELRLPGSFGLPAGFSLIAKKVVGDTNSVNIKGAENNISNSSDFATWNLNNVTVGNDAIGGPERNSLADKIQEDTSTGSHDVSTTYSKAAGVTRIAGTVRMKAAERTFGILFIDDNGSTNRIQVRVDLSDGSLDFSSSGGTYTLDSYEIVNLGDGWYEVKAYVEVPSAADTIRITTRLYDGSNQNYTGVTGNGIYVWGPQLTEGLTIGSYLETTGAAAQQLIEGDETYTLIGLYESVGLVFDGEDWLNLSSAV